jgi:hypothetical protein
MLSIMFNRSYNPNGPKLTLFSRCCTYDNSDESLNYGNYPISRLCSCAPSLESSMCHEAEKWLFHIPHSNP